MTLKEHKKHTAIARPANGNFGRNEWAILGGPCTVVKVLADRIISALSPQYQCAYADTSHNDDVIQLPGRLTSGAALEYTDQLNFCQLNYKAPLSAFKQRQLFAEMDLVLVNGNHQQAKEQVVIIDINKRASLQKRVVQLSNVVMILLADNADEVFDFVKDAVPNWHELPTYKLNDDTAQIVNFFHSKLQSFKPVLNGLVLAGGKSARMGVDKGRLNWYGKEQRYYMADLLHDFCSEVFISCRDEEQKQEIDAQYATLTDTFTGLGPYGAILSAFRQNPEAAWLVVACDMPLVDDQILQHLTENRSAKHIATAYHSEVTNFPEPLITIWEPKSYPALLQFLAQGYSCPRKVLINSDINLLQVPDTEALSNVNTPEEMDRVRRIIHNKIAQTHAS
ncbi:NTP transferase domain-containing protein [Mucilaginibacter sp.]|uniref:NTP transferase domain-containing protein n=1 Tax=Mucilaginibacter sp. TaxID=1882438 RepID=UPI003264CA61